jgi:hypothetical protein
VDLELMVPLRLPSYDVINEILRAMNNRLPVRGIFCDLKKAFALTMKF